MAIYAWKCAACEKSFRADAIGAGAACPECGHPLIAIPPKPPEPQPRPKEHVPPRRVAAGAGASSLRPSNPFDVLAEMASSSTNWIPDAEVGPSPSLGGRQRSR